MACNASVLLESSLVRPGEVVSVHDTVTTKYRVIRCPRSIADDVVGLRLVCIERKSRSTVLSIPLIVERNVKQGQPLQCGVASSSSGP